MSAPVISTASSILGFRRREQFSFTPAATGNPFLWTASGLPPGVSIETYTAQSGVTGDASTDVVTLTGHLLQDGTAVYFPSITGGSGLAANTIYFVRDKTDNTLKLAATAGGVAIDFTTNITAGSLRRVSTGRISGSHDTAGTHLVTLTATNGTGTSAAQQFVLGFSPEIAPDAGSALDGIGVTIRLPWGEVVADTPPPANAGTGTGGNSILFLKGGDVRMLVVRFVDAAGLRVDPEPVTLKLIFKEYEPDSGVVLAEEFEKEGSGATAEFFVPVDLTAARLRGVFSNYERDAGTRLDALAEFEWTRSVTFNSSSKTLRASTPAFPALLERDLIKNA